MIRSSLYGDCSVKIVSDIIIILLSVHKLYDYDMADLGELFCDAHLPHRLQSVCEIQLNHRRSNITISYNFFLSFNNII